MKMWVIAFVHFGFTLSREFYIYECKGTHRIVVTDSEVSQFWISGQNLFESWVLLYMGLPGYPVSSGLCVWSSHPCLCSSALGRTGKPSRLTNSGDSFLNLKGIPHRSHVGNGSCRRISEVKWLSLELRTTGGKVGNISNRMLYGDIKTS